MSPLCGLTYVCTYVHAHTCMLHVLGPPRRTSSGVVHWAVQAALQLTVDLARRAHQSPGRLVNEDGLRGLPLAQRTGQGQSGVVPSLCGNLFASRNHFTVDGKRTACVLPFKSVTGLFVTLGRQDSESRWRHTSIDRYIRIARTRACTRTVYTSGEQGRELQFAASIHRSIDPEHSDRHYRAHVTTVGHTYSCDQLVPKGHVLLAVIKPHVSHMYILFVYKVK